MLCTFYKHFKGEFECYMTVLDTLYSVKTNKYPCLFCKENLSGLCSCQDENIALQITFQYILAIIMK